MPPSQSEQTAPSELKAAPRLRVGVDVGGTFTDLVATDGEALHVVKVPSTPPDFHLGVIAAVARAGRFGTVAEIIHGSTVATNALLQRAGAPVAFVTTRGFRDMLLIGRQNRPDLYALNVVRPAPLVDEQHAFTIDERIDASGAVVRPPDPAEVDRLVGEIVARGLKHVAVCLLFSFINPAHEQLIRSKCEQAGLKVSLSSDVLPEFREYERASTTVINAALRPVVEAYLNALERGVSGQEGEVRLPASDAAEGATHPEGVPSRAKPAVPTARPASSAPNPERQTLNPPLRILHSSGGTLAPAAAARNAARLVLSGPAGGVLGAAFVARQAGFDDVITYDMGGTSTDVAVILGGRPQWTTATVIEGLPIGVPMFDIHTVGAGGGSVAYLDAGGALRVGPRSAGAAPGPACYGRGGVEPTVTDANLVLGRILPDRFLGGAMRIDPHLAHDAIGRLASQMGKTVIETALGIVRIAEANMEHAIRAVTSRRGHDPRRFTLVSFGGAGGLHACALAGALGIPRVLIPPYCGVLSALGMVVAPPVADASKTVVHVGAALDDERLAAEFGGLSGQTIDAIPYEQTASVEAYADVRFKGQSHEVKVKVDRPSVAHIIERFAEAYRNLYGQVPGDRAVEIVTLRLRRFGHTPEVRLPGTTRDAAIVITAQTLGEDGRPQAVSVHTRSSLVADGAVDGPILLVDPEASAYAPNGWRATPARDGSVVLQSLAVVGH